MAVAVRSSTVATGVNTSPITISTPAGTADGDLMLLCCACDRDGDPTVFAATGFSAFGSTLTAADGIEYRVLSHPALGEGSSYSVTSPPANSDVVLFMLALTGANTASPVAVGPIGASGTDTTLESADIGSGAVPAVGDLDIRLFGVEFAGACDFSTPSGFTEHQDADGPTPFGHVSVCTRVVTTAGAQGQVTSTATATPLATWRTASLAVAQAIPPYPRRRGPNHRR